MFCNKYLEEFKIDLVKQYFNGRPNKDICNDYKIAKSTLWGWICKYGHMVQEDWEVNGIESVDGEYVDITAPMKREATEMSMIQTTNETIRIFKNGYSIICHISKLDAVMRIIGND